ncbi:MAG TPA: hypothetical protein VL981_10295 [Candidatus Methylacidiphilales bacterium]|nr:hypothetical protein [Candidatus Methylacidiphilales bacterium]
MRAADDSSLPGGDTGTGELKIEVATDDGGPVVRLYSNILVTFENTSDNDMVLNLGMMLGNKLRPTALTLQVTKSDGTVQKFPYVFPEGGVGAGVQTFLVPLPAGAAYKIPCPVKWFISDDFKRVTELPPGSYTMSILFVGKAGTGETGAPACWTGTVKSDDIPIKIPKGV